MIDFEIPAETKAIREKVRTFVQDECIPAPNERRLRLASISPLPKALDALFALLGIIIFVCT